MVVKYVFASTTWWWIWEDFALIILSLIVSVRNKINFTTFAGKFEEFFQEKFIDFFLQENLTVYIIIV